MPWDVQGEAAAVPPAPGSCPSTQCHIPCPSSLLNIPLCCTVSREIMEQPSVFPRRRNKPRKLPRESKASEQRGVEVAEVPHHLLVSSPGQIQSLPSHSYGNQHSGESPAPLSPSTHFSESQTSKQLLGQASPKEQRQPQEHLSYGCEMSTATPTPPPHCSQFFPHDNTAQGPHQENHS